METRLARDNGAMNGCITSFDVTAFDKRETEVRDDRGKKGAQFKLGQFGTQTASWLWFRIVSIA